MIIVSLFCFIENVVASTVCFYLYFDMIGPFSSSMYHRNLNNFQSLIPALIRDRRRNSPSRGLCRVHNMHFAILVSSASLEVDCNILFPTSLLSAFLVHCCSAIPLQVFVFSSQLVLDFPLCRVLPTFSSNKSLKRI